MPACPWFTLTRNWKITGKVRFRTEAVGWFTKRVVVHLEAEHSYETTRAQHSQRDPSHYDWKPASVWRSIDADELNHPALRWIVDGPRG